MPMFGRHWERPDTRIYEYNITGEHYYDKPPRPSYSTSYLNVDRGSRGISGTSRGAFEERSTQTQSWVSAGGRSGFNWKSDGHSKKYESPILYDNHRSYEYDRAKSIARCESLKYLNQSQSRLESELAIRRAKRASSEMKLRSSREPSLSRIMIGNAMIQSARTSREPSVCRAPLVSDAMDRYNKIDEHLQHKEMMWEVAHRISMLEKERETLTRQISEMKCRPSLWV